MLQPNTAVSSRSIWFAVDQLTFHDQVKFLEAQNVAGKLSTSDAQVLNLHDPRYLLPLASEQRLADDIAFLAAYEPGAGYVSATTVEALEGKPGIRVCLAANRGVTEAAGEHIRRFLSLVEQCARKGSIVIIHVCPIMLTDIS
jgi:hypothetical protein